MWVAETTGVDRPGEIILGGLPMEQGECKAGGWFAARREDGRQYVLEGTPAAFWPDGSVKWLHLCGAVDLVGGCRNHFTISPGADAPAGRLTAARAGNTVEVAGGALDVRVAAAPDCVLAATAPGGRPLLQGPGLSAVLRLADPDAVGRQPLLWNFHPREPRIAVQTANRVVVRLPGIFVEEDRLVAEMVLFVEVLREAAQLRLQPVFIYLGDPDRDLIAGLTLTIHGHPVDAAGSYGFGAERGPGCWSTVQPIAGGPTWPMARQVQLGSTFYRTEKRSADQGSWVKAEEGQCAPGWCHLSNGSSGLTAAMRYYWQEYPHSLTVDAARGNITFGLVPPEAQPLDLRRYSPTCWGPLMYEHGEGPFPAQTHGATGIAKSFELMVMPEPAADAAATGFRFAHPVRIMPEPAQAFSTGVFGPLVPAPVPSQEPVEEAMARMVDFLVRERDVRGWYGLLDFGDLMIAYYSSQDRWGFDDGGYAWLNTEGLVDLGLWLSALRHGRADWLEAAVEMTRHNRDVDSYHRGQLRGCGTRHNVNHWGCSDKEWRVTMPLVRRLHYYLTGDPWTLEVIRDTIAVYQSYERTASAGTSFGSALAAVLVKHELTGDAADGRALRNLADTYARAVREDGHFVAQIHADIGTGIGEPVPDGQTMDGRYFFVHSFGLQHALVETADLLDHRELKEVIVRHAALCLAEDHRGSEHHANVRTAVPFLSLAWRHSGDDRFRQALREAISKPLGLTFAVRGGAGALAAACHEVLVGVERRNKVTCAMGGILHLYPYGLSTLAETPEESGIEKERPS